MSAALCQADPVFSNPNGVVDLSATAAAAGGPGLSSTPPKAVYKVVCCYMDVRAGFHIADLLKGLEFRDFRPPPDPVILELHKLSLLFRQRHFPDELPPSSPYIIPSLLHSPVLLSNSITVSFVS